MAVVVTVTVVLPVERWIPGVGLALYASMLREVLPTVAVPLPAGDTGPSVIVKVNEFASILVMANVPLYWLCVAPEIVMDWPVA